MWNPWHGCHRYSEGCKNCYMFSFDAKRDIDSNLVHKTKSYNLPLQKNKTGEYKLADFSEVSVCLTSDFFLEEADPWRSDVWKMIKHRQNVRFILFTKRVQRIETCLPADWGDGYDNVAVALTTENQKRANERIPIFLTLPIKCRQILVSPILEKVDLTAYLCTGKFHSVYCGGENYANARECDFDWVLDLSRQCQKHHTNFVFYDTGCNFVKDGKRYFIPHSKGHEQALRAGINNICS